MSQFSLASGLSAFPLYHGCPNFFWKRDSRYCGPVAGSTCNNHNKLLCSVYGVITCTYIQQTWYNLEGCGLGPAALYICTYKGA